MALFRKTEENPYRNFYVDETARIEGGARGLISGWRELPSEERGYLLRRARIVALGLATPFVLIGALLWTIGLFSPGLDATALEFEEPFAVRITEATGRGILPGSPPDLVVTARPEGTEKRRDALRVPITSGGAVDEVSVEFVNELVAFVIAGKHYTVTTDGGHTWRTSTITDPTRPRRLLWIQSVVMDEWGLGVLFPRDIESVDSAWTTEDYGVTWQPPGADIVLIDAKE